MLVIGIAGGSGSGKTTVVNAITEKLKERVVVIPQDSYYKDSSHLPMEERQRINFDHPDAIDFKLLCEQLQELKNGKTIEQPVYSYITCSRSKTETVTVEPAEVIIIEGILVFTCKELRNQMDIKIFVDADDDDRLMRVMARDILERARPWRPSSKGTPRRSSRCTSSSSSRANGTPTSSFPRVDTTRWPSTSSRPQSRNHSGRRSRSPDNRYCSRDRNPHLP